ncbi:MAG: DNA methyltransferase [Saprospiraceae bacterium]
MTTEFSFHRLPKALQGKVKSIYSPEAIQGETLKVNEVHQGDARHLLPRIAPNSIAVSVWSPPYFVGKSYEENWTFEEWQSLLKEVIDLHFTIIKPGGFLAINIADILCFKDEEMPKIQADSVQRRKVSLTKKDILEVLEQHPNMSRDKLAAHFSCSEQTIDRRLNGNNARGGKYETQTRVKIVGGLIEEWAMEAGFYPYDRRVWVKDAAWENSRWTSLSYKAVDEFEYIYILWKPGITKHDRERLSNDEWKNWGSRGVWSFPSVRANDDHEAKFPLELPRRIIKLLSDPGETVLDCFLGSGTTAVAALLEERNFIGIELNEHYARLATEKIAQETGLFNPLVFNAN